MWSPRSLLVAASLLATAALARDAALLEEAHAQMDALDLDKDGFLALNELLAGTFEGEIEQGGISAEEDEEMKRQLGEVFQKADKDGDGKLSKEELPVFLDHLEGLEDMTEPVYTHKEQ